MIVLGTMRRYQPTTLLLAAAWLAASATAKPAHNLFERASTCGDPTHTQCSQAGLPSDFCCGPSSDCIVLAGNTTVLCCPSGSSCSTIRPIGCDITQQNATANPDLALMTTALTAKLPTCGDSCCPFGYSCSSTNNCVLDANQDIAPTTSSAATTNPPTPSSTTTSSTTVTPVPNEPTRAAAVCTKFPVPAILVGFFPGLLLGAILSAASIFLLGARGRKAARRQSGSSFGNISEPQPQSDMRTDFLRKQPQTPSTASTTVSRQPTVQRVRSLFRKSTGIVSLPQNPRPAPPVPTVARDRRPVTPVLQREPSFEDINIFADGDTASALRDSQRRNGPGLTVRESHQTTFSDMMEKSGLAGLQKGQRESPVLGSR
jgi:hypothetical protein